MRDLGHERNGSGGEVREVGQLMLKSWEGESCSRHYEREDQERGMEEGRAGDEECL